MRLYFQNLEPTKELMKVLLSTGFHVQTGKKAPSDGCDLIGFQPKTPAGLSEVAALRKKFPQAWICVCVPAKWLTQDQTLNTLLETADKNDLWTTEDWETRLWFSLQSFAQFVSVKRDKKLASDETASLKNQVDELSARTETLVSQLEKDLSLASNIQRALLPRFSPDIPGITLAVRYLPAAGKGGDYYDIFEFGDKRRFGFLLADASSHGMAAALLSVLIKVRLEEMKDRFPDSKSFVEFLNKEIRAAHGKDSSSMSLMYGILDRSSLSFQFTTAGTQRPLLFRDAKPMDLSSVTNPPLGTVDHFNFQESTVRLQPGDFMLFHTDGLNGPLGGAPSERIANFVKVAAKDKGNSPDPREVQNELMGIIDQHTEKKELADDLTLIHFSVNDRALYLAS